jgi:hypothetical protein
MSAAELQAMLAWLRREHDSLEPVPKDYQWRTLLLLQHLDERMAALENKVRR